jgi:hypothetical protein
VRRGVSAGPLDPPETSLAEYARLPPRKSPNAGSARNQRFHLLFVLIDQGLRALRWGFVCAAIVGVFFSCSSTVGHLAGKTTVVDGTLNGNLSAIVKLIVNKHLAEMLLTLFGTITGGAYLRERKRSKALRSDLEKLKSLPQKGGRHAA